MVLILKFINRNNILVCFFCRDIVPAKVVLTLLVSVQLFLLPALEVHSAESAKKNDKKPVSKLVEYEIFNLIQSKSIPKSLTGVKGSPKRGEALMIDPAKGNCLQCHELDFFHEKAKKNPNVYGGMGEIGPTLDGVASRYKESQLRLILVNAKMVFPETIMPAYYRVEGLTRVGEAYKGGPIMTAQEIEDVLSFLVQLK